MTRPEPEEPAPRDHVDKDDIEEEESRRRYYERLSDWSEPSAVNINRNGRLLEVLDRKEALAGPRAQIELTRLALERESAVVRGWLDQWAENIGEMQTMEFDAKRLRLAQMGIEAIVRPKVSGPDRVQVVLNLPFDQTILHRNPDRPEFNWTAENDRDYDRFTRLFETPDGRDPSQTLDTPPLSPSCGNNRSAPCAGIAGDSLRRGRPDRQGRSRW